MAGVLPPVLKGVYVCDDVIGNPVGGKPMIVNLWDTRWVAAGATFPVRVPKLCVFAWLRGGRGRMGFHVDIVSARTGDVIGRTPRHELDLTEPNRAAYTKLMIEGFLFPEPGGYIVELYCEGVFLDDQPIRVRVRPEGEG